MRLAAFIRPIDAFSVVDVKEATVTFVAKSQSMRAMGKEEFSASKSAVLDFLDDLIGVERGTAQRNAGPQHEKRSSAAQSPAGSSGAATAACTAAIRTSSSARAIEAAPKGPQANQAHHQRPAARHVRLLRGRDGPSRVLKTVYTQIVKRAFHPKARLHLRRLRTSPRQEGLACRSHDCGRPAYRQEARRSRRKDGKPGVECCHAPKHQG
ncbi:hypothetical protein [Sinorhizobium psoraleae]|uniref:Uncharacterized protein n=1 Tax=Sinorhizobium psoraleae TaxID=520838 RepID=A0ABT4KBG2_9HYPH|nr:hypothetical protein [Sinorhizobium psoraleae]MCZ4089302.1 hypothetical protein [Sinorhizobium psoraleae]